MSASFAGNGSPRASSGMPGELRRCAASTTKPMGRALPHAPTPAVAAASQKWSHSRSATRPHRRGQDCCGRLRRPCRGSRGTGQPPAIVVVAQATPPAARAEQSARPASGISIAEAPHGPDGNDRSIVRVRYGRVCRLTGQHAERRSRMCCAQAIWLPFITSWRFAGISRPAKPVVGDHDNWPSGDPCDGVQSGRSGVVMPRS